MTQSCNRASDAQSIARADGAFPWLRLLALTTASFLTILTEALPAGLLPQISASLNVSQSLVGQWVSIYALGSLLAAIPLTALTRSWRRKPLLLGAVVGFAVANLITTLTDSFAVALVARFVGGVSAGVLWALLAGYAVRMAPKHLGGRAMALALAGTPIALSIGMPAGTLLGAMIGWRVTFGLLSAIAAVLALGIAFGLPDFPGEKDGKRSSLTAVFALPGIRPILVITLAFVLAHNVIYTYIAPLLVDLSIVGQTDRVLLAFGIAGLVSIGITGLLVDRWLHPMILGVIGLFLASAAALLGAAHSPFLVYGAVIAWGLGFGGAATLFQTASARAAGPAADVAQAMIVTVWNIAIAAGAVIGGFILDLSGAGQLPWAGVVLLAVAGVAAILNRPAKHPQGPN